MKKETSPAVHHLKVTLNGTKPKIWRSILVKGTTSLQRLHFILQGTMGWQGGHAHQFNVLGEFYGCSNPEWGDPSVKDERRITLDQIVSRGAKVFVYEYDFGDGWEHEIKIEKVLPMEKGKKYPVCTDGRLACPPEDCGGIPGYYELLDAIKNPKHENHKWLTEWLNEDFDPKHFSPAEVNRTISRP